jgi:hypothetical protein
LTKETHYGSERIAELGEVTAAVQTVTTAVCSFCNAMLKLAAPVAVGKAVKCAKCGQVFKASAAAEPAAAPAAAVPTAPAGRASPDPAPASAGRGSPDPAPARPKGSEADDTPFGRSLMSALQPQDAKVLAGKAGKPSAAEAGPVRSTRKVALVLGGGALGLVVLLGGVIALTSKSSGRPTAPVNPVLPTPPDPNPTFTIKLKIHPAAGATVERRQVNSQTVHLRFASGGTDGKGFEEKNIHSSEVEFTEIILDAGEKVPRRFQRSYTLAKEKINADSRPLSYEGRTVVFELDEKKNEYKVQAVGEPPLTAAELAALARRVTRHDQVEAFLPQKVVDDNGVPRERPVRGGETWPIDLSKLKEMLTAVADVDLAYSSGEARLSNVRKNTATGQLFGVIKIELKLSVRRAMGLQFAPPAEFVLNGDLDAAIDGSSFEGVLTTTGKLSGKTSLKDPKGGRVAVEMTMELSGRDARSAEK